MLWRGIPGRGEGRSRAGDAAAAQRNMHAVVFRVNEVHVLSFRACGFNVANPNISMITLNPSFFPRAV